MIERRMYKFSTIYCKKNRVNMSKILRTSSDSKYIRRVSHSIISY